MEVEDRPDTPPYSSNDVTMVSREQASLDDFASRLGSSSFIQEPCIFDEKSTRKEASLLMSLLATTPKLDYNNELDHRHRPDLSQSSSSDSERSLGSSEASTLSSSSCKRRQFRFTCPSLSLDNASISFPSHAHLVGGKRTSSRNETEHVNDKDETSAPLLPATLLGRPLKVEDVDALRLSADAMARNVLQSYQKALDWRVQTWINALQRTLVEKEKVMLQNGADEDELKQLLHTREARLLAALLQVAPHVSATGSSTSFRVLAQRMDDNAPETDQDESSPKRRRVGSCESTDSTLEEIDSYTYSVSFALVLECVINLETPAGFGEITLHVPGTMEGTFLSGETGREEMKSVVVNLDTDMLSAMIEKSCRIVIRTSVESAMEAAAIEADLEASQAVVDNNTSVSDEEEAPTSSLLSPTPQPFNSDNEHYAAIITPRYLLSDTGRPQHTVDSHMLTIPDDFDEHSDNSDRPRQISPQPGSPALGDSSNNKSPYTPQTPMRLSQRKQSLPLISPPLEAPEYHEVPANGPSLPMLVEAACRAMQSS